MLNDGSASSSVLVKWKAVKSLSLTERMKMSESVTSVTTSNIWKNKSCVKHNSWLRHNVRAKWRNDMQNDVMIFKRHHLVLISIKLLKIPENYAPSEVINKLTLKRASNKKVLLCERKMLIACHVASTRYAVPLGGTPLTWALHHWSTGCAFKPHWGQFLMKFILFYVTLDLSDNLTEMCIVKNSIVNKCKLSTVCLIRISCQSEFRIKIGHVLLRFWLVSMRITSVA